MASHRALNAGAPEVTFEPEGKRVVAKPGMTLLEAAEAGGLPIESGCRMGVCGADPVCVSDGMENLSAISDDERSTLDRLGLADNTRMACCARVQGPVTMKLDAREAGQADALADRAVHATTSSVERVVVLGNGIAGVTAADHVRRRHPLAQIDLVAEEAHHLYNRMGIARLIYGRSAMQGLYLNPDAWYEEHGITPWLNTRARKIDRAAQQVVLGTGEALPYDRLILATGSSSFVPPIEGFGGAGHVRAADRRRRARAAGVRPAPRRAARGRRRRRPARARGGLRAAQARAAHDGARARRPAAAAPARRARVGAAAGLPRGARARDRARTPRRSRCRATAA